MIRCCKTVHISEFSRKLIVEYSLTQFLWRYYRDLANICQWHLAGRRECSTTGFFSGATTLHHLTGEGDSTVHNSSNRYNCRGKELIYFPLQGKFIEQIRSGGGGMYNSTGFCCVAPWYMCANPKRTVWQLLAICLRFGACVSVVNLFIWHRKQQSLWYLTFSIL